MLLWEALAGVSRLREAPLLSQAQKGIVLSYVKAVRGLAAKKRSRKCRREVVKAMKGITMRNIDSRYMLAKEGIVVRNVKVVKALSSL